MALVRLAEPLEDPDGSWSLGRVGEPPESNHPPSAAAPKPKRPRLDWATLQARTFGEDVWRCPCGGRRRVLAVVSSHRTAEEVLQRLGLLHPRHGPDPPQLSLSL